MLPQGQLLREFSNHMIRRQRVPTALISVTVRSVEALYRALEKYYIWQQDPENLEEIWIAIIFVPDDANMKPHHARELAQQLMDSEDANAFKYEYLFEREIPESYLEHNIPLKELIKRGLSDRMFLDAERYFPSTLEKFRKVMMSAILSDAYDADRWLGCIARAFGVRAPCMRSRTRYFQKILLEISSTSIRIANMSMCIGRMIEKTLNFAVVLSLGAYAILKTESRMSSIPGLAFE